MERIFSNKDRYAKIIEFICMYKNISRTEIVKILKDTESRYLLLLLLEKYKCVNVEQMSFDFNGKSSKSIKYNLKKAEEKFFINREFREAYFEMEEMIKKII
jgi:hypothetical protein